MTQKTLTFWYDFASTYSYLAAARIDELTKNSNIKISWQPFLLGSIFKAQGLTSSPFNHNPAKGNYMWHDLKRSAKVYGIKFQKSAHSFPQNGLLAARAALCLADGDPRAAFSQQVYAAEFIHAQDIAIPQTISDILDKLGHNSAAILEQVQTETIKQRLRDHTNQAISHGIFGAPSFLTPDQELFWGDDRLQQAIDWTVNLG